VFYGYLVFWGCLLLLLLLVIIIIILFKERLKQKGEGNSIINIPYGLPDFQLTLCGIKINLKVS
jgi:hypothetical protein